ncbi:MAG: hypothetical protein WD740_00595 [Anaerolineales bacterium]
MSQQLDHYFIFEKATGVAQTKIAGFSSGDHPPALFLPAQSRPIIELQSGATWVVLISD